MRKHFTLILCAMCANLIAASCGKTATGSQPEGITKAETDSVAYMMGYSFGMQLKEGDFGPLDMGDILAGMKDARKGVEIDYMEFQRIVNGFLGHRREIIANQMVEKSKKYLDEKRKENGVDSTTTGVLYRIIAPGGDRRPTLLDTVEVNYEGRNLAGKIFDSSYERGTSATFPLQNVIKGWSEGIQLIGEGGAIELYIPAEMAYGPNGAGADIAPNEALTFKVELLKIIPYNPKN